MPSKPMKELLRKDISRSVPKKETLTTLIPNSIKLPNGMENCLL
jgi:hypothetical protein